MPRVGNGLRQRNAVRARQCGALPAVVVMPPGSATGKPVRQGF